MVGVRRVSVGPSPRLSPFSANMLRHRAEIRPQPFIAPMILKRKHLCYLLVFCLTSLVRIGDDSIVRGTEPHEVQYLAAASRATLGMAGSHLCRLCVGKISGTCWYEFRVLVTSRAKL